jgi:acetyl esterase/lipase
MEISMPDPVSRPPIDPELETVLGAMGAMPSFTADRLSAARSVPLPGAADMEADLAARGITARDVTISGYLGDDILLTVFGKKSSGNSPAIYYTHGGGMVMGNRFAGVNQLLDAVTRHDAVMVSVEYRLAPEHPDPYPVEDCYAGLVWAAAHAHQLGIDPDRLVIAGSSAGGGLAAGTALLTRDRQGPRLAGQLLMCPMLDDRDQTVSTHQIDGIGLWDRTSNTTGWTALLGDRKGGPDVSIYAAPARATNLTGLPTTYIDCGSAEVFRDEDVAYATALWAAGVQAELHIWAGGFHGFELFAPHASISQAAARARENWLDRLLRP